MAGAYDVTEGKGGKWVTLSLKVGEGKPEDMPGVDPDDINCVGVRLDSHSGKVWKGSYYIADVKIGQ
jgi:hypothetical protein